MPSVAFVCLHGSAKSLIAASHFMRLARERGLAYDAVSMGLEPDAAVPEAVVDGLWRDGFDVARHAPRALNVELLASAARVVTFGCDLPPSTRAFAHQRWDDVPLVSEGFEPARDVIVTRLKALVESVARAGAVTQWREHFPALSNSLDGREIVYLDSAATSHRPREVIDEITRFYERENANPGPTLHALARRASERYDEARATVARFVGAASPSEVVFTRGTTEAINLVATAWGGANLTARDEVLIGLAEHASSMMPWQTAARRAGATIRYFGADGDGRVDVEDFTAKLSERTKVVAFSHVSNVLGIVNPVDALSRLAHEAGAVVCLDAAQSVPHVAVDVAQLGSDFVAFSGHKMCGPMGAGVLWAKHTLLEEMSPYQYGSNMAHAVGLESAELSPDAHKFGAGTPNVADALGLAAAARFHTALGRPAVREHEMTITTAMLHRLASIPSVRVLGRASVEERVPVFSFVVDGMEAAAVAAALDREGIAVRAGDLASLPLLQRFGVRSAVRASCYLYTTLDEVQRFGDALERIAEPRAYILGQSESA